MLQRMKQYLNRRATIRSMSELRSKRVRLIGYIVIIILFLIAFSLAIMTYNPTGGFSGPYWSFAVEHHMEIMIGVFVVALAVGFLTSQFFYAEAQRKKKDSKEILHVVMLFLSTEEKEIVNFLVEKRGVTTQSEIARLPHMNRVRAHRSLQKMEEKQIIDLVPHGKIRKVHLKENMLHLLLDE